MKNFVVPVLASLVLSCGSVAFACTEDGKEGIFPENNLYFPVSAFVAPSTSKAEFFEAISKAESIYTSVFAAQGRTLKIIPKWDNGTVNAYARRFGKVSQVHMYGGLARHPKITADGFTLVLCHEIGHHLGGAPKSSSLFGLMRWASNEGQSDYFATLKCAREMWKDEANQSIVEKLQIPAVVTERCQKSFDKANDLAICQRTAVAGKSLADTLADLKRAPETSFETPDAGVVTRTDSAHPAAQCRLDTYFAGAVCAESKDLSLSDTDATVGTCTEERGQVLGIRPRCWYKPAEPGDLPPTTNWPSGRVSRR